MKSSVQWLLDRIEDVDNTPKIWEQIKIQAKEMHKKEVENGFNKGYRDGFVDGLSGFDNDQDVEKFDNANLYYNETFEVKESGMSEKPTTQTEKRYSEEDMKQFAWECVANFLSNRNNKVEMALVEIIIDRNNNEFEQFKNK